MKDTIKQLSKRTGISSDTIRHYRECGIIHPRLRENGYYEYSLNDLLMILLTREMRSMDVSLSGTEEFLERRTMKEFTDWLDERQSELSEQIRLLQLEADRLRETRIYASCGVRLLTQVEEFDGPPTWAVGCIGVDSPYTKGSVLKEWFAHFPFTYISVTILQKDLISRPEPDDFYPVTVGCGALEKYTEEFHLPLPDYAVFQPGGHFIRTCIRTKNIFRLTTEDLSPLFSYAAAHHYRFVSPTGGRILFADTSGIPEYYLLIWVRVDPCDDE